MSPKQASPRLSLSSSMLGICKIKYSIIGMDLSTSAYWSGVFSVVLPGVFVSPPASIMARTESSELARTAGEAAEASG